MTGVEFDFLFSSTEKQTQIYQISCNESLDTQRSGMTHLFMSYIELNMSVLCNNKIIHVKQHKQKWIVYEVK